MSYAVRVVVSALMLAGAGVMGAAFVVLVAVVLVVGVGSGGVWTILASVALVALTAAAGAGLVATRRRHRRRAIPAGVLVTSDEQPRLWVEVYRVAEGLDTKPPDTVLLVPGAVVALSESRTWLGLRPGVSCLHLGLPLLSALTQHQLRAVLARELSSGVAPASAGHVIQQGQKVIGRVAAAVGEGSIAGRLLGLYGHVYVAIARPIIRRYELEADLLSAELAGSDAASSALREVMMLSRGWDAFVRDYADPAVALKSRPVDLFAGFAAFLDEPSRRVQLDAAGEGPGFARRSSYDVLPLLGDRLAAMASLPDDDLRDTSKRALDMLRNPDREIRRVEDWMFREPGFVPGTWEEIMPDVGRAAAREDALRLVRLGRDGGLGSTLTVSTLLDVVRHGLADEMVRPSIADGGSPEVERQEAGRLVAAYFATAAIESGTAHYRWSWATPRHLVDGRGEVEDLPRLVHAALGEPAEVSALHGWLLAHRVGIDFQLGDDDGSVSEQTRDGRATERTDAIGLARSG